MMSGPHPLHAGDGYEYLTRQVASGDRERDRARDLTDYYTEHGTPPGQWFGRGAALLGIEGQVTEQQMQALFGEGLHPDADRLIAEALANGKSAKEAVAEAKLGAMYSEFTSKKTPISEIYDRRLDEWIVENNARPNHDVRMVLRTDAAREYLRHKLGRKPTTEEINNALAGEKKETRRAVTGFDCVFTPPKSVSVLWGLADDQLRRAIYECHRDAVRETLRWAEDHFALARRGKDGIRQIDADGLIVAMFEHYDNRTGDPNPHTHCVISTKVSAHDLDPSGKPKLDKDGNPIKKWSALDARSLFAGGTSLSCMYNAISADLMKRRIGFEFVAESRGRGKEPVMEIADVPRELREEFSRRADIVRRTEELVADYRERHGRNPSKKIQRKLAQQATLDTRENKPVPKSLREMIAEWNERAHVLLDGLSGPEFANRIRLWHRDPSQRPFQAERVAIDTGVALGGKLSTITADPTERGRAIDAQLRRFHFETTSAWNDAWWKVASLLEPMNPGNVLDRIAQAARAAEDRVYDRERVAEHVLETVSRRRSTWNEAHIRAATYDRLARCEFADESGLRTAVEEVVATVRDTHSLLVTIDPDDPPKRVQRRNGESQFNTLNLTTALYTSQAVLDAEDYVRTAAQTPTAHLLTRAAVDEAIAQVEREGRDKHGREFALNAGQRSIVRHLCMSGMRHDVAVGPAGAGKTTAMAAVVRAWINDGRQVIALSPQKSAAEVLSEDIGVPATTIDSLLVRVQTGNHPGIAPGTMILVDEAAMASTAQLHQLQRIADQHGAVVKAIGDPYQLSAVEAGGLMRLIARETKAPVLSTVVRFTTTGEDVASLHARNGDAEAAFEWYQGHERVTSGMTDELRDKILSEYLRDRSKGTRSLMMAATIADVSALNGAAQAALGLAGEVKTNGASHRLSDGHRGYVGDVVVTRLNTNKLRVTGGVRKGASVDNGNLWTIKKVHEDGSLTVVGIGHRGTVNLPADYVRENVELGYATTVHRAQGMTVDRAYLLLNKTLGRALAYVGLTRGRDWNGVFLATDTVPDPTVEVQPDEDEDEPSELDLWLRVMAREDDNLTATEVMRQEHERINDPKRMRTIYDEVSSMLAEQRARHLLERALPTALWAEVASSDHLPELISTLTIADHHRLDTAAMVVSIATNDGEDLGESLGDARDTTAMLRARADRWIRDHLAPAASSATTANVETFAVDQLADLDEIGAAMARLNADSATLATTERGGRFYAVRDAEYIGLPPVPPRYAGMDIDLADYAEELRNRLLGPGSTIDSGRAAPPPPTPSEREAELAEYDEITQAAARRAKLRRDYDRYVADLYNDHARYLLDRALPTALWQTVERSRGYRALIDTIALADAHRLDTAALVSHITSDGGRDYGESLLKARDAGALLRYRADAWINEHLVRGVLPTPPLATLAVDEATTLDASQFAIVTSTQVDVLAVTPPSRRFRALDDLDPPRGLAPIPPEFPGMDTSVADYADELRRRLLDLDDDAPTWRERAARHSVDEAEITDDYLADDDDWLAAPQAPLMYQELDYGARLIRLRAELDAARAQVDLLSNTIWAKDATPHGLAVEPIVDHLRARRDELAAPLHALRTAREDWETAEAEAAAAEQAYERALRLRTDEIDSELLDILDQGRRDLSDPELRDQMQAQLDELRAAMLETQAARVETEIAHARHIAESARRYADERRANLDTAQRALDLTAGGRVVPDAMDVEYVRDLASTLAGEDLAAARERIIPLNHHMMRARTIAIEELAAETGMSLIEAAEEVDRRFQPTDAERASALARVLGREHPRSANDLVEMQGDEVADAAVEEARRSIAEAGRAFDLGIRPARTPDDAVARTIRARADALMPFAIAARTAEREWRLADDRARGAEYDYEQVASAEPDPWLLEDDPAITGLLAALDALPSDAPEREQMTQMLEQYRELRRESAVGDIAMRRQEAQRRAVAARAHADQMRAAAEQAQRVLDEHLADPIGTDVRRADPEPTPAGQPGRTQARRGAVEQAEQTQREITADTPLNEAAAAYLETLSRRPSAEPGERAPHAPAWLPAPPADSDTTAAGALARRQYAAITARTARLAEAAAEAQPDWTGHLGPLPSGAVARAAWIDLAGQVAAWREQFGIDDIRDLLGARPDDENRAEVWDRITHLVEQLRARAAERGDHRPAVEHQQQQDRQHRERWRFGPENPDRRIGPDI